MIFNLIKQDLEFNTKHFSLQANGENAKMISISISFLICCLALVAVIKSTK